MAGTFGIADMDDRDTIANALRANVLARKFTAERMLAAAARGDRLMRCRDCDHQCQQRDLGRPEYEKRTIPAVKHLEPGDCEPAEYVTVCPDCGAEESFDLAP